MEFPTIEMFGRKVAVSPSPDSIADRIAWALHNVDAIGSCRKARGLAELEQLAIETGIPNRDLEWFMETLVS